MSDGDGERVDVRYPDLYVVRHWLAAAGAGGCELDRVEGYLAGMASCVLASWSATPGRHLTALPADKPQTLQRGNASFPQRGPLCAKPTHGPKRLVPPQW